MSRFDHRYVRRRLDAYVDDELGGDDVDWVTGHMLECPDCSAHVRVLLRIRAALRTAAANRARREAETRDTATSTGA